MVTQTCSYPLLLAHDIAQVQHLGFGGEFLKAESIQHIYVSEDAETSTLRGPDRTHQAMTPTMSVARSYFSWPSSALFCQSQATDRNRVRGAIVHREVHGEC